MDKTPAPPCVLPEVGLLSSVGNVDQQVDGADELARRVEERRRIGREGHPPAIGTLGDGGHASDSALFLNRHGHGTSIMRQGIPLVREKLPRDTPAVMASERRSPRKIHT